MTGSHKAAEGNSMDQRRRHITIQRGNALPRLQRCKSCCSNFHCPFCMSTIFKPAKLFKLKVHLQCHFNKSIVHEGYVIHRCGMGCRSSLHYHCLYCASTLLRKVDFKNHLLVCKHKEQPTSDIELSTTSEKMSAPVIIDRAPTRSQTLTDPVIIDRASSTSQTLTPVILNTALPTNAKVTAVVIIDRAILNTASPISETVTAPAVLNTASAISETVTSPAMTDSASVISETVTAPEISPATTVHTDRIRLRPLIKERCPICSTLMNKKNLKRHMERRHSEQPIQDINATSHLTSQCIDKTNGIFTVLKVAKGQSIPLHIQYKTWGENHKVFCESNECQDNMEVAQKSGLFLYQCKHIRSVSYCKSSAEAVSLKEDVLTEMVSEKWFSEEEKHICLARQQLAYSSCVPLSVQTTIGIPQTKKFISVFEPHVSSYSRLGRVMVVYDANLKRWHCPCIKLQQSCVHKYVSKWHLFQTHRELVCD